MDLREFGEAVQNLLLTYRTFSVVFSIYIVVTVGSGIIDIWTSRAKNRFNESLRKQNNLLEKQNDLLRKELEFFKENMNLKDLKKERKEHEH